MKGNTLFQITIGVVLFLASALQVILFLRGVKKNSDESTTLSASRFQYLLTIIIGIVVSLFLMFYRFK